MKPVFLWRERSGGLDRAVTDRHGGDSAAPFASFNLGGHVGDTAQAVEANRQALADALAVPRDDLLFMQQCHGREVVAATGPWAGPPPQCDALVTDRAGLALAALVADCVPVLLADPGAGVVGAVHAGRPGLAAGVVDAALDAMADLGARAVEAVVGPSVCGRCYEVPPQLREDVATEHPSARTVSWTGTPALDIGAGVVARLHERGARVVWVPGCTREHPDLYSFRRSGATGRFAATILRYAAHPAAAPTAPPEGPR